MFISNRFQPTGKIKEGGLGRIIFARDMNTGLLVAIKELKAPWTQEGFLRFKREIEETKGIAGPGIVQIIYSDLNPWKPYYVMPYYTNGSLRDKLQQLAAAGQTVNETEALKFILLISQILDRAHDNKIIHRDLKPENILFDGNNSPLLADFGLGKFIHRQSVVLTLVGQMGTPDYCAPEQWQTGNADEAADIFSLGIILHELLTGFRPQRHSNGCYPPSTFKPSISSYVDQLFLSMTQYNKAARIKDCKQLNAQIKSLLGQNSLSPAAVALGGIALVGLGLYALSELFNDK